MKNSFAFIYLFSTIYRDQCPDVKVMWKKVYFLLVFFRFCSVFRVQYGYIHPDEFFQGPEKITGDVFQYDVFKAWEFDDSFPIRSPYMWYLMLWYPFNMLRLFKMFGLIQMIESYWLIVIPRFMMTLLSLLTDSAIMKITASVDGSPYLAGCISSSSYITFMFSTRTFSNSVELFFTSILLASVIGYVKQCRECEKALETFENHNKTQETKPKNICNESFNDTNKQDSLSSDSKNILSRQDESENTETFIEPDKQPHNQSTDKTGIAECDSTNLQCEDNFESINTQPNGSTTNMSLDDKTSTQHTEMDVLMNRVHTTASKKHNNGDKEEIMNKYLMSKSKSNLLISVIIMAGVWNRPTFIGFATVPVLYWLFQGRLPRNIKDLGLAIARGLYNLPSAFNASLILILFDTSYYRAQSNSQTFSLYDQLVVTPINFISYNKNSNNLAEHGIHPRYLHALVNCPLLFGPMIAFVILLLYVITNVTSKVEKNTLLLLLVNILVPLCALSIFPHQEPRFMLPLMVPCVIISSYCLNLIDSRFLYALFFLFWFCHNLLFGFLFGYLHQAGVVPSLLHLHKMKVHGFFNGGATIVYHRTYMPPKSLLQISQWETKYIKLIDLQGRVNDAELEQEFESFSNFYLITPYRETYLKQLIGNRFTIKREHWFYPHLSMEDPPNFGKSLFIYDSNGVIQDIDELALDNLISSLTLNLYKVTNRMVVIQMYPEASSSRNQRHNLESGAYETLVLTLPKVKSLPR